MQRADRHGFGTALAGHAHEILQGLGIAEATIARATQGVQLHAESPGARDGIVHGIADAVATAGCHGQGERLAIDLDVLIAHRNQAGQEGFGVQLQIEPCSVLKVDFARCFRFEVVRQVETAAEVDGQQRWQTPGLLHLLQFEQAGVDFLGGAGWVAQAGQHVAQNRRGNFLRATVGVDPVHRQAGVGGEYFQLCIAHGRSPSGGCKGAAAVRLTSAQ
ncbi:hypothetical protein D3C73_875150 [compost metagenome]